jgi:ATP-dependent DNA helicase RecQ
VTAVPSLRNPELVHGFAQRLAVQLGLEFRPVVAKRAETEPQKRMENSAQQSANVAEAFVVTGRIPSGAVFLVDDIIDSRWTVTMIGARLREAGSGPVFPLALAQATGD